MLWIAFGALTAAALAALVLPVIRAKRGGPGRAAYNLAVYQDQLREIDIDVERGVLSADEAEPARVEISRRMLDAGPAKDAPTEEFGGARSGRAVGAVQLAGIAVIAVAIPAIAISTYVSRGSPDEPGQPFASRSDVRVAQEQAAPDGMAEMVRRLAGRLAAEPDDLDGWLLLGRTYTVLERYADAADAYGEAAKLAPGDPMVLSFLGESLVYSAGGTVTQPAIEAFDDVLAAEPRNVAARYYRALARAQAGRFQDAFDSWFALAADSPADAPWLPDLRDRLEETADELGIDFAMPEPLPPAQVAEAPAAPPAPARGPTAEDIEAAGELDDEDRGAFIRSMVERLAARLEENPDDLQGWSQLARSYEVLGETEKAAEARAQAERLRAGQTAAAPAAPVPPARGPTQDEIDSAAALSAEQRGALIGDMVARLAARLEDEPDDAEGWLQLARSYEVLERAQDSEAAYARAAALRPNDVNVLALYARSMLRQASTDRPLAPRLVDVYRRIVKLDGQNPEALYFAGLGEAQAGNTETAVSHWERLLSMLDPGSEAYGVIEDRLKDLRAGP